MSDCLLPGLQRGSSLSEPLCKLLLTSISEAKQKPQKTKGLQKCLKASLSVLASLWSGNSSLLQPIESGIDIPYCWVPEHDHTRLTRSMLINRDTLPLTSQIAEDHHNKVPQPFHLQTAHKMSLWNHLLLDRLQLLEVCNYLGLFLRKHVHQSSQRVFFTKAVKSPHSAIPHPFALGTSRLPQSGQEH